MIWKPYCPLFCRLWSHGLIQADCVALTVIWLCGNTGWSEATLSIYGMWTTGMLPKAGKSWYYTEEISTPQVINCVKSVLTKLNQ